MRKLQDSNSTNTTETDTPLRDILDYPTNMDPNVMPDVSLYTIDESYPDQSSSELNCKNDA